ncbi:MULTISPECIES: VC0807 family protein [Streptomyces]|uniref:VC0807 family protein n=1 Tax=Streptomyces TaxID=1883 RepID=UPI001C0F23DE|nr:VC0807 family protein [Streptomyces kasugaensis]
MSQSQSQSQSEGGSRSAGGSSGRGRGGGRSPLLESFLPLIMDAGVPMASYYLLGGAFGLSEVAALGWSSVVPVARTVWGLVRNRRINGLALLILLANAVGLALSSVTGDPRLMLAKDSGVTGVVGIVVLLSVRGGRPLMTAGLRPWVTKGSTAGNAAWDRLWADSARFRRAERRFSVIWGSALLAECVVRVIGAYTVPVHTMVWLSTVLAVVAIMLAMLVAGGAAAEPMREMVEAERIRTDGARPGEAGGGERAPEYAGSPE